MALANGLAGALPLRANLESFCYVKVRSYLFNPSIPFMFLKGISMFSNQSQNEVVYTESAKECWELCTVYEECKNWTFHYDNHGHSNVRGHKNGTHKCLLITSDDAPVISEDSNAVSGSHMCGDSKIFPVLSRNNQTFLRRLYDERGRIPRSRPRSRPQVQEIHRCRRGLPMDLRHDPRMHALRLERDDQRMPIEEFRSQGLRFHDLYCWKPQLLKSRGL